MLLVPLLAGISPFVAKGALPKLQWFIYGALLILIIGLRHEVGGDWSNYIENYAYMEDYNLSDAIMLHSISRDFGFEVIHWFSVHYLNGIYSTNMICASIFVVGLVRLCKNMPVPWIALVVAMPYLVIVVAMGYTRQAASIGFVMWGLIDLMNGKKGMFYTMVILGAMFHKTTMIMLPVGFLFGNSIRNPKDLLVFVLLFFIAFATFLADSINALVNNYLIHPGSMKSSGALIRVMMNMFAALVFLFFRKSWINSYTDASLWVIFTIITIGMVPLTFVTSTTTDRLALFFLPMQLVIFSRTPVLIVNVYNRTIFVLFVLFFYISVMFVWLNYGNFSSEWLPYQNLLFK